MNNEELKKKIADIIYRVKCPYSEDTPCKGCQEKNEALKMGLSSCTPILFADALIAAGIGDVNEAGHSAEKAEKLKNQYCRALLNLARRYVVKTNMTLLHGNEPHSRSTDIEMLALYIMANECEQAEKELAEERKDD